MTCDVMHSGTTVALLLYCRWTSVSRAGYTGTRHAPTCPSTYTHHQRTIRMSLKGGGECPFSSATTCSKRSSLLRIGPTNRRIGAARLYDVLHVEHGASADISADVSRQNQGERSDLTEPRSRFAPTPLPIDAVGGRKHARGVNFISHIPSKSDKI